MKTLSKSKGVKEGDLLSNCCAWEFDSLGYEKEEGIWQERCLRCGKLCEPLWIGTKDIQNIRRCFDWNSNMQQFLKENPMVLSDDVPDKFEEWLSNLESK